ncbi:MAG: hypothetical protein IKZ28_02555, partial [Clostridia bacterium]|nr:hypothetical protein [Clostridia bacterium]
TQFVIQKFKVARKKATLLLCCICALLSIPIAWSVGGAFDGGITLFGFDLLTFFDEMTNTVLMPVGAMFSCICVGWFIGKKEKTKDWFAPSHTYRSLKSDGLDIGGFTKIFAFMVKYFGPLLILFIEIFGIIGKIKANGTHYWWVIVFSVLLIILSITVYFLFFKNAYTGKNEDEIILENNEEQADKQG